MLTTRRAVNYPSSPKFRHNAASFSWRFFGYPAKFSGCRRMPRQLRVPISVAGHKKIKYIRYLKSMMHYKKEDVWINWHANFLRLVRRQFYFGKPFAP
jgi:hypothetical protein